MHGCEHEQFGSFLGWNGYVELLADLSHQIRIDLAMTWNGAAEVIGRVQNSRMVSAFAQDFASLALQMPQ